MIHELQRLYCPQNRNDGSRNKEVTKQMINIKSDKPNIISVGNTIKLKLMHKGNEDNINSMNIKMKHDVILFINTRWMQ